MNWSLVPPYVLATAALLGWLATWSKSRRESRAADREEDLSYAAEVRGLRQERREWLDRESGYEKRLDDQEAQIADLKAAIEHFKKLLPMALVGSRFLDEEVSEDLAWLLEVSGGLWWVTSPVDRASVVWASPAWERLLGCTKQELLGTSWRTFLHPASRASTSSAEARAWRARVDGFVNTFVGRDGAEHELRWFAPPYGEGGGITLALAIEASKDNRS